MNTKKRKIYLKQWKENRKVLGLCRSCNEKLAPTSKVFCPKHLKEHSAYAKLKKFPSSRFRALKNNASRRNISVDFLRKEFDTWMTTEPCLCRYCGITENELKEISHKKKTMTIDRKNNMVGYTIDNICWACHRCNNSKSNFFTEAEWLEIAEKYIKPRLKEYHGFDK